MNAYFHKIYNQLTRNRRVKTEVILQLSTTECGIAALAMLLGFYGVHLSLEKLRTLCGTSRDGVKAVTLISVAESLGFDAGAFRVELPDIALLDRPVIAYWRFNHYVVIHGVDDKRVFIHDPAVGAISVSYAEFDRAFTGIVIDLKPTDLVVNIKKVGYGRAMLNSWLSGYGGAISFVFACLLITIAVPMLNARLTAILVDYCIIGHNTNWLPVFTIVSVVLGLVLLIALRLHKMTQFRLMMKTSLIKSAEMMEHLLHLPLLYFSLRQKPEIAALINRSELIATSLFQSLANSLVSVLTALVTLLFLIKIDYTLTLLLLLLLGLLVLPIRWLTRLNTSYEQANITLLGQYYSCTLSTMKNIESIKIAGLESANLNKWTVLLHQKITAQDKSNNVLLLMLAGSQSFNSLSMLMTLCMGSLRVASGELSVGGLMAFYGLQLCLSSHVMAILHAMKDWQHSYATQVRLNDMLAYPVDSRFIESQAKACIETRFILSCRDLMFYYNPTEPPVLSNIHLNIKQGEHVALIGGTGSGKSTLAKVLAHLYQPAAGNLWLYGREWKQGGADELSTTFAYVSQETSLFSGTIYDNLTLWKRDVPLDVIQAAIHDACLSELIQQRGLYGMVEESGSNFSGGERQRLDIARALIQSPTILVLDEATSALDVPTEAKILMHLRQRPLTILFVAHRLSTVRHCDQIIVMERGLIIEQGNHDELLQQSGHYFHLLQSEAMNS